MKMLFILTIVLVTFDRAHWNVQLKSVCCTVCKLHPSWKNWGRSLCYSVLIFEDLSDLEFSIFIIIGRNVTFLNLKSRFDYCFLPSWAWRHTAVFPPLNFHILSVFLQFLPNPGLKFSYNLWLFLLFYHEFRLIHGISCILCFFFHLGLPLYFHAYLSNSLC